MMLLVYLSNRYNHKIQNQQAVTQDSTDTIERKAIQTVYYGYNKLLYYTSASFASMP